MTKTKESIRKDYEELKDRFTDTSVEDFKKGGWFFEFVRWMLQEYAENVDADYIRKTYPGAGAANQSKKIIKLARRQTAICGGLTAGAISAFEVSSLSPAAVVTVPAIGTALMGDVAYTTKTQLSSTYDLSVIHGAPLSMDDVEDCYLVFLTAMGVKLHKALGGIGKSLGPKAVAYNVRKMLRKGVRKAIKEALKKIIGSRLARKLTERAMMKFLVPGISVPIAWRFNSVFTRNLLQDADKLMMRRGKVVRPLVRLYSRQTDLPNKAAIKSLIAVMHAGDPEAWSEEQMNALRYCQQTLSLSDDELSELDGYFDRSVDNIGQELPELSNEAADALLDLLMVSAALYPTDEFDAEYADAISGLSGHVGAKRSVSHIASDVEAKRTDLYEQNKAGFFRRTFNTVFG